MKLLPLIIFICELICLSRSGSLPDEQNVEATLISSLLNGYNKIIQPKKQVEVEITASIKQIIGIDEKQQVMTSSLIIAQRWNDPRLSWSIDYNYSNITAVMLPVKSIWIPDTMILNSADSSGYLSISDYSLAAVEYTGEVFVLLPVLNIKTRCSLNARKFPFDRQECSIALTSWIHTKNRIMYIENNSMMVDLSDYAAHPLWELENFEVDIDEAKDRSPLEDSTTDIISVQLFLKRKPLFFMMNGIFACLILNAVTLLSYALPFGSQVGLCMTCFMTYSVYSLNFSNLFPQQSEYLMMITLYFLLSICWTLISMLWFTLCNHYVTRGKLPSLLNTFAEKIQKLNKITCSGTKIIDSTKKIEQDTKANTTHPNIGIVNETNLMSYQTNLNCNFCARCETCQATFDKEKEKTSKNKEIVSKCNLVNNFIFLCTFIIMFSANLGVWLAMSQ